MNKFCECGCKKEVNRRFVLGHHRIGKHLSEETKKKISNTEKGKLVSQKTRFLQSLSHAGKAQTQETKGKISKTFIEKGINVGPKSSTYGTHHNRWENPIWKEMVLKKVFESNAFKPNRLENKFDLFLQNNFPNQFDFVGDGKIFIGGKVPDWFSTDGKKIIIELFGNYFHSESVKQRTKKQEEDQRIDHFKKYGYKTLIIWENEVGDSRTKEIKPNLFYSLREKIEKFINEN